MSNFLNQLTANCHAICLDEAAGDAKRAQQIRKGMLVCHFIFTALLFGLIAGTYFVCS